MSYFYITMDINKLKQGYERCKLEKRYQLVNNTLSKEYLESAEEDLHRAKKEFLSNILFWSIAALDSAVNQMIYGLSIREKGLRPKSRVCAENLVCSENIVNESEYKLIVGIREIRNKAMYDALFRKDLKKAEVNKLLINFENFLFEKGGKG